MKLRIKSTFIRQIRIGTLIIFSLGCLYQIYITFNERVPALRDFRANFISPYGHDFISEYNTHYDSVHQYLLPNSKIGYYSEPGENYVYWGMHMCLTQYNIAPAIIMDKQDRDTILYNLYNTKKIDTLNDSHIKAGWKVWKDFGNGLILLKK